MNIRKHAQAGLALALALYLAPGAQAAPWTPTYLANKALWLDAADSNTVQLSGNSVTNWLDKSGNGRHAVQATASYQPAYVTNDLNGLNGINFASNKGLYKSSASFTAAFAILVVKSPTATWGGYHAFFDMGSSGSRIGGLAANGNTGFYSAPSAAWLNGVSVTPSASCFGSGITNANVIAYTPKVTSMTSFSVGNYDAAGGGGAAKQYELLVLSSSPSLSDRQRLEGYLAWKWGTQASLPAGHPYKSAAPEINPPIISSLSPVDGASNVATGANLALSFDQSIAVDTGNITLRNLTDNTQTTIAVTDGSQVSVAGAVLTINPTADLTAGKDYAVRVDATAVKNIDGSFFAGIADDTTWNFTTDDTPPTVATLSPADNATNVTAASNFVATFSEPIAVGTGNITVRNLTDNTQTTIAITDGSQVSVAGSVLTINPTADLTAGKDYAIRIDATAVKDVSGNFFAGIADDTTWNFATVPANLWKPSQVMTNLALWLDAADGNTVQLSGSSVTNWLDKSGNGRHAVQATASYRPAYTSDLNGLNGINFASDKGLYNSSASFTAAFAILVVKSPTATWGSYHAFFDRGSSGSRIGGIAVNGNTGFYTPLPSAAWLNGVSVAPSTSCFGSGITNANIIAYTPSVTSLTSFSMGNFDAGASGGAAKQYELLVLSSSPSLSDRQKLEGYLAWKWGTQASLPADHPYKSVPPTLPPPRGTLISFW